MGYHISQGPEGSQEYYQAQSKTRHRFSDFAYPSERKEAGDQQSQYIDQSGNGNRDQYRSNNDRHSADPQVHETKRFEHRPIEQKEQEKRQSGENDHVSEGEIYDY